MEIGSIFEIDIKNLFFDGNNNITFPFMDDEYEIEFFNTGRAAIESFLKCEKKFNRVWLPAFICTSVIDAVKRAGKEICYYPITKTLQPDLEYLRENKVKEGDVLYVMQYFGICLTDEFLRYIDKKSKEGVLIFEDITMALLSKKNKSFAFGDVIIASIRKWIGVPDGAFLASKERIIRHKKQQSAYDYTMNYFVAQIMKSVYLIDSKAFDKERFLSFSNIGIESLFTDFTIRDMSEVSRRLIPENWEGYIKKRRKNYELLYELLKQIPQVKLLDKCHEEMLPMGMFIITRERDTLLNFLISRGIYCNVHWRQNEATELFEDTSFLSRNCITIPCDHRYDETHMIYIFETIQLFFGGGI